MKSIYFGCIVGLLSACNDINLSGTGNTNIGTSDTCGASAFMEGQPIAEVRQQNLDGGTRYFGADEVIPPANDPTRLNFVVSTGSVVEAALTPGATVTSVFCG